MMKLAESVAWLKANHKRPAGIVLALEEPHEVNQVILYGQWRVRVAAKLTRGEFMARLRKNARLDGVGAVASVAGSKIDLETAEDLSEPGPEFQYFYVGEVI